MIFPSRAVNCCEWIIDSVSSEAAQYNFTINHSEEFCELDQLVLKESFILGLELQKGNSNIISVVSCKYNTFPGW